MNQNYLNSRSISNFFHLVPDIPESFLTESFEISNQCREKIIYNQRISTLLPLFQSKNFQLNIYNKNKYKKQNVILNNSLFQDPIDALSVVTPQQIQFISNLANYITTNPETMIQALQNILIQSVKKENSKIQRQERYNDFLLLCYSAIPSFFGFFSTNEHLNSAFSFFCTVVSSGTSNLTMQIVKHCLLPFYCNGCTYRFIESVFDKFGTPYCHDPRFHTDSKNKRINISAFLDLKAEEKIILLFRDEYLKSFINAIVESYPLLPQPHQFLIKFMKVRGWTNENVLYFFIHDFVLTQISNIMKSTPFSMHYEHFSTFFVKLVETEIKKERKRIDYIIGVSNVKDNNILPSMHSVYNLALLSKKKISKLEEYVHTLPAQAHNILENLGETNNQILYISKAISKANYLVDSERKKIDLIDFFAEYIYRIGKKLYGSKIKTDIQDRLTSRLLVTASPLMLSSILENLIGNSIKAKAENFIIEFTENDQFYKISFIDDGKGLDLSITDINRIFEFGVTTTSGAGLGLFYVKKYISDMEGELTVKQNETKGLTFTAIWRK